MDNLDQTKRDLMDEVKGKILTMKPLCLATKVLALTPLTHSKSS